MSEEMARKKKEDIENLEKKEKDILKEVAEDRCPSCGLPTSKIEFFNMGIIKAFGWVECTLCGNVYCPKSILKQKKLMAESGLAPALQSSVANPASKLVVE
jgi:hypothetical protein